MQFSYINSKNITEKDNISSVTPESKSSTTKQNKTIYSISNITNFITGSVTSLVTVCISITARAVCFISSPITWVVINRAGLAQIAGKPIVPSQIMFGTSPYYKETIELACKNKNTNDVTYKKIQADCNGIQLDGVICYPPKWDKTNKSQCNLLHNPNGMIISEYFNRNDTKVNLEEDLYPKQILNITKSPIILYDYRGTGINNSRNSIHSTADSVVKDGVVCLDFALTKFDKVNIIGLSLGGGIATVSLNNYLQQNESINADRVKLYNLDSFTNIPRVILPTVPTIIVDFLGWLVGANINAESAMKNLINRNVKIKVFNHEHDRVIPKNARMSTFLAEVQEIKQAEFIVSHKGRPGDNLHCSSDNDLLSVIDDDVNQITKKTI